MSTLKIVLDPRAHKHTTAIRNNLKSMAGVTTKLCYLDYGLLEITGVCSKQIYTYFGANASEVFAAMAAPSESWTAKQPKRRLKLNVKRVFSWIVGDSMDRAGRQKFIPPATKAIP